MLAGLWSAWLMKNHSYEPLYMSASAKPTLHSGQFRFGL